MFRLGSRVTGSSIRVNSAAAAQTCGTAFQQLRCKSDKKKDHYEVLGVAKGASEAELKKAYRKRAMATHPDKGGNKEEFASVSEAYEVLSSPDKRRMYDQYGHDGAQMQGMGGFGGGAGGRSAQDIFEEFFRNAGFGGAGGGASQGPVAVEDLDVKLSLTLEDIYNGASKTVRVRRPAVCADCRGEGTKKAGQKQQCTKCSGSGRVVQRVTMGPGMVQQMISACPQCEGAGTSIRPEDKCGKCHGEGFVNTNDTVTINVPAGVPDGAVLVMAGAGGDKPNSQPGNLNVHLEVLPHRQFKRRGDDLLMERNVSLVEALTGVEFRVTLPDGRNIIVKSEDGKPLKHNGVIAVMNEGLPKYQRGGRGHLYVVTKVVMPSTLTSEQKEALEKVFGKAHREEGPGHVVAKSLRESIEELEQAKAADWSGRGQQQQSSGRRQRGGQPQEAQCNQM
jgi:chaperone protein DnaJ